MSPSSVPVACTFQVNHGQAPQALQHNPQAADGLGLGFGGFGLWNLRIQFLSKLRDFPSAISPLLRGFVASADGLDQEGRPLIPSDGGPAGGAVLQG